MKRIEYIKSDYFHSMRRTTLPEISAVHEMEEVMIPYAGVIYKKGRIKYQRKETGDNINNAPVIVANSNARGSIKWNSVCIELIETSKRQGFMSFESMHKVVYQNIDIKNALLQKK